MNFKFRKRIILVLFITLICVYLSFYLFMFIRQKVFPHHNLFIQTVLFSIVFSVRIVAHQNRNILLKIACYFLLLFSFLEILNEIIFLIRGEFVFGNTFDFIFHIGESLALILFTVSVYFELNLRQKQEHIRMASFFLNEAIYCEYHLKRKKVYLEFSSKLLKKYGLNQQTLELTLAELISYVHPEDRPLIESFEEYVDQGSEVESKCRIKLPGVDSYICFVIKGSFATDERWGCLGFDVSDLEKVNKSLQTKIKELNSLEVESKKIIENTKVLVLKIDLDGTIIFATQSFIDLYSQEKKIIGSNVFRLYEKYGEYNHNWFQEAIKNHTSSGHGRILSKRRLLWISWTNDVLLDKQGKVEYVICVGNDTSDLVKLNMDLEYRRNHNTLTGLLNNQGFYEAVRALKQVSHAVCFFIDITNFSMVNNYYGNQIGDALMKEVAAELNYFARKGHLVSRYFGEKFAILLVNPSQAEVNLIINKLQKSILSIHDIDDKIVQVKKSIGYAVYPEDTQDLESLVTLASLATRDAAMNEHNIIVKYLPQMSQNLDENIKMATRLYNSIQRGDIEIHFQKIFNSKNNAVTFIEALARWNDLERGNIRPDIFIKVAKESNLIDILDEYLIRRALAKYALLKRLGEYKQTKLSINFAPSTFLRDGFVEILEQLVADFDLENPDICIEVSENTFVHNLETCNYYIQEYKKRGFLIAIDDFGSQYSSLSILENIDYDIIKIDGSFINNIDSPKNKAIIKMVIEIAQMFKKEIIAESVETEMVSLELQNLECFLQQGYYYHKPERLI